VLQEFAADTARGGVLVGAAACDRFLELLLKAFMAPSPTAGDPLFDTERPLSSFSARIDLAFRLGLVEAGGARALHLLRRIRNSFAHETHAARLDAQPFRDQAGELVRLFLPRRGSIEKMHGYSCRRATPFIAG
jgi:hypothetical protein